VVKGKGKQGKSHGNADQTFPFRKPSENIMERACEICLKGFNTSIVIPRTSSVLASLITNNFPSRDPEHGLGTRMAIVF
jgi:hypothetical protein